MKCPKGKEQWKIKSESAYILVGWLQGWVSGQLAHALVSDSWLKRSPWSYPSLSAACKLKLMLIVKGRRLVFGTPFNCGSDPCGHLLSTPWVLIEEVWLKSRREGTPVEKGCMLGVIFHTGNWWLLTPCWIYLMGSCALWEIEEGILSHERTQISQESGLWWQYHIIYALCTYKTNFRDDSKKK